MNVENSLIEFRISSIHGHGGFARQDLAIGTRVIQYVGERIDKQQSLERCSQDNQFIFHLDETWDLDGNVDWNPARLINHSCSPNCVAELIDDGIWIIAARAISAGEEITFNYSYDLQDYRDYQCRCGAPNCVGFIVAEEFFDDVRRGQATKVDVRSECEA
jgi:uncharacterized protein